MNLQFVLFYGFLRHCVDNLSLLWYEFGGLVSCFQFPGLGARFAVHRDTGKRTPQGQVPGRICTLCTYVTVKTPVCIDNISELVKNVGKKVFFVVFFYFYLKNVFFLKCHTVSNIV